MLHITAVRRTASRRPASTMQFGDYGPWWAAESGSRSQDTWIAAVSGGRVWRAAAWSYGRAYYSRFAAESGSRSGRTIAGD